MSGAGGFASQINRAVDAGLLSRDVPCEACNSSGRKIHFHHWDYTKPLDVIPLCAGCHQRVHHGAIPEPRTGRVYLKGEATRAIAGSSAVYVNAEDADLLARLAKREGRTILNQFKWCMRACTEMGGSKIDDRAMRHQALMSVSPSDGYVTENDAMNAMDSIEESVPMAVRDSRPVPR